MAVLPQANTQLAQKQVHNVAPVSLQYQQPMQAISGQNNEATFKAVANAIDIGAEVYQKMSDASVDLELKEEHNISFLYITHDLSTAYQIGDNINIMRKGEIVESGKTVDVINNPTHPYVQLLVDSIPSPNPDHKWKKEIDFNQEKYLIM